MNPKPQAERSHLRAHEQLRQRAHSDLVDHGGAAHSSQRRVDVISRMVADASRASFQPAVTTQLQVRQALRRQVQRWKTRRVLCLASDADPQVARSGSAVRERVPPRVIPNARAERGHLAGKEEVWRVGRELNNAHPESASLAWTDRRSYRVCRKRN